MPTNEELDSFLKRSSELAVEASQLLRDMQGTQKLVKQKDTVDLSTSADTAAESLIIKGISASFPDHAIFSEEVGRSDARSDYLWIIDPLDGTKEYSKGSDDFNVLIALEYQGELIVGVYYRNINGCLYQVSKNQGAFRDNVKLEVSTNSDISKSIIGFRLPKGQNGPGVVKERLHILERLINAFYRVRCPSDDAHSLAMVAAGLLDAHIIHEGICDWYDIAPALLLVTESGGQVTDFYGNTVQTGDFSKGIVASNGSIHEKLLELITH